MNEKITIDLVDPEQNKVYQGQDVDVFAVINDTKGNELTSKQLANYELKWSARFGPYSAPIGPKDPKNPLEARLETDGVELGTYTVTLTLLQSGKEVATSKMPAHIEVLPVPLNEPLDVRPVVTLGRSAVGETPDVSFWLGLRGATTQISFNEYLRLH